MTIQMNMTGSDTKRPRMTGRNKDGIMGPRTDSSRGDASRTEYADHSLSLGRRQTDRHVHV